VHHPQAIEVVVDERSLTTWAPSGRGRFENHSVLIPADPERPHISTVKFRFESWTNSTRAGADLPPKAARFDRVTLRASQDP
jgi:hypothetical protein